MERRQLNSGTTLQNKRCFSDIAFNCHYPEENPEGALEDITNALANVGVFDGIKNT